MATYLYGKNAGGTLWYKYYCRKCRKWITFTTSWLLDTYGCSHYSDRLPFRDGSIVSNRAWFAYNRWIRLCDLDKNNFWP
ncbi:MAG: hypothetical protein ACPLW7_06785 [Minisyncoccia bacterium]